MEDSQTKIAEISAWEFWPMMETYLETGAKSQLFLQKMNAKVDISI